MLFKYINNLLLLLLLLLLWIVVSALHWQFHQVNIFYSTKSWLYIVIIEIFQKFAVHPAQTAFVNNYLYYLFDTYKCMRSQ